MTRATPLDEALEGATRAAAAKWPKLALDPAVFIAYLRERLTEEDPVKELASVHTADLYLACACLAGDAAAWRELDRAYLTQVGLYVCRIDASPAFCDDVRQRLAEKLLPDGSDRPTLTRYSGRGPLGGWMRVAAIREAHDVKRGVRPTDDISDLAIAAEGDDIEVGYLKRKFAHEFETAFQQVLGSLATDERNVLRLHYLDGQTIEQVGKTYGVSRATAARWLASARAKIVEQVRASLAERITPSAAGPASVLAFVRSQLRMSLRRHLT